MNARMPQTPDPLAQRFAHRTALVTGGAGGMGRAICQRLHAEGAEVIVMDRARDAVDAVVAELDAVAPGRAHGLAGDLADPAAIETLMQEAIARASAPDVLINVAGINRRGRIDELATDDWRATFAVNIDAIHELCRLALPAMAAHGQGAIVNIASQWGLYPAPGHIAYNASKAALVSFSRSLARDHAGEGIRVNAICPGEILTPMVEAGLARSGRTVADLDRLVPFGRVGRPEEVAALTAFLASDEAPYLTGSVIEMAGAQAVA